MRWTKIFYIASCALALFPLLKLNHFSMLIIVWLLLAFIVALKNKTLSNLKYDKYIWLVLSSYSLMYLAYFPFATDFYEMKKMVVKSLPFLVFPLGFILNKELFSKTFMHQFLNIFVGAVATLNVFGWFKIFQFGYSAAWQQNNFYQPIFREIFGNASSLHLPYLGLLSVFAALVLVYKMMLQKRFLLLQGIVVAFLMFSVYIYSARMALACFILGTLFMLWQSIKSKAVKWSLLIALPIFVTVFIVISPLKERYFNEIEKEMVLPHKNQLPHEVNYRYGIWHCATKLISNHLFTGVGADKVQEKLNTCYATYTYESYEDFTQVTYNTHNQYFDQLLKFGLVGLGIFIFVLFYFFKDNSILYQVFLLVVATSFLTENILDRQTGVVFVSLLNTIFVVLKYNRVEKSISSRLVG